MKRLEVTSSNLRNKSRKLLDIFRLPLRITQLLAMSTFALQADGNIDVVRLEKDLRNALDFDVKYKQTDNMKKKACKISADYDEFKAYVACAHLKTVRSRTEISSLGTAKKGWHKSTIVDNSSSALILTDELKTAGKGPTFESLDSIVKKPKTPMELERDLRKSLSILDKKRYLSRVGLKRVIKLLQADGNAELLESIILVLLSPIESEFPARKEIQKGTENIPLQISDRCNENVPTEFGIPVMFDNKVLYGIESFDWLEAFTALNRFDLIIRFFSRDLITNIIRILEFSKKEGYEDLILKYKV